MIDEAALQGIGELRARCLYLESQVATLTAFVMATLETGVPKRDELETRWTHNLALALVDAKVFDDAHKKASLDFLVELLANRRF